MPDRPMKIFAWCDSQIVLGWLNTAKKLSTFVSNRVEEIRNTLPVENWHYCQSASNPADLLTRGNMSEVLKCDLWLHGPDWLVNASRRPVELLVEKSTVIVGNVEINNCDNILGNNTFSVFEVINIDSFALLYRLLRITALVRRFVSNMKSSSTERTKGPLSASEITDAQLIWVKHFQSSHYSVVLDFLSGRSGNRIPLIDQLQLFLDSDGVIRCKVRLQNTSLPDETKFPILIPKNSRLADLIVRNAHFDVFHFGISTTVAKIRGKFWIPQIRQFVKSQVRRCVPCRRLQAKPFKKPDPPTLPSYRVDELPAFSYVGVDYCGPLVVEAV
ncbi:uncharacterized protein LOC141910518 [Tubulanus polymorphus]|uniref:uncharacterized protein LOC141910518 n=1 Tax=Tubulanus polymorphus TaxID=672921 RepID=UPI003DA573D3